MIADENRILPEACLRRHKENRRMYVPFICTCIGMVMMFYIISYLHYSDSVAAMRGGAIVQTMLNLGTITVGIFSCIFLFYTNSFLIRRRKKNLVCITF